ncbi:MAG: neuraminidase-like domain-containing protein, partial [Pseudanabaena sp. LacPavin_0818_WC45_MAG_42_6]|nr:neuraminidase-like domain-containing protein [Pseudanabaena sp. LacPavin_0818_WC45_MAG_42_6]
MCACMNTSRIKQAISSVQLFVQRCLLNLEPRVKPSAIDSDRWQWTKNYRVWEANCKVFLYPENWIEPELRDNKSPFFKELESELLQTDVTNEAAEKALLNYLYKLDQVARLEVCGMYLQEETDGKHKSILHVFARAMGGVVRSYYYRRLLDSREWTPWEKVELDINGVQGSDQTQEDGIHLLPVVWNRRLYLFWLIFTQKAETPASSSVKVTLDKEIPIPQPTKYWEIKLAWSKYEQGKWLPKQISESYRKDIGLSSRSDFRIKAFPSKLGLELLIFRSGSLIGRFTLGDTYSAVSWTENTDTNNELFDKLLLVSLTPRILGSGEVFSLTTTNSFMGYSGHGKLGFAPAPEFDSLSALESTPSFRILSLNQPNSQVSRTRWFYQDGQHIYFVRSREGYETIVKQVANPQKTSPFPRKELAPSFQGRLPVPKVDGRLEKSVANPWVLAEQQLVVQKLTTFATRSGSTFSP